MIKNFTFQEFLKSTQAEQNSIVNIPDDFSIIDNILFTAQKMQEIRALLQYPILITSGYRSQKLNSLIGGSLKSQHLLGQAVDFISPKFGDPYDICKKISDIGILFDQMILEPSWIHISFNKQRMRNEILTKTIDGYEYGLKS